MSERELFIAALQKENLAERQAYLDAVCVDRPELREQVQGLLRLYENAGSFLQKPAAAGDATCAFVPTTATHACEETPGTMIGPYKLLQQIGEGGMGTVFMAEQTEPVKRKVALKVIKAGMDSRQVVARFEAERQALAMMDHVNIARVFDGGTTENGRPYFVMELVHGVPITKYCDDNRLTPRQRLELFVPVCQAIQHAHQKGIIHRDIKPSNVMVTLNAERPVVKVIDFGIEWRFAGEQFVEQDAERVDVAAGVYIHFADRRLFRAHVFQRADHGAVLREQGPLGQSRRAGTHRLGHAEVDHLGDRLAVVERDHHVGRLDVAVDDPLLVGMLDCLANRHEQLQSLPRRQAVVVAVFGDGHAVDQFHHEIRATGIFDF